MSAVMPLETLTAAGGFALLLKAWRGTRKLSQLDLALNAGVSQRHLSFLESGRAHPSRDMVLQLCEALEVPLRERNTLLEGAGFAALYRERGLDAAEMSSVKQALEISLKHHEPFPAIVVNRDWNLLLRNQPAEKFLGLLGPPDKVWARVDPSGEFNVMRMTCHPQGMQPLLRNFEHVALHMLSRLQREVATAPASAKLRALLKEVSTYPGMPDRAQTAWQTAPPPILPLELGMDDITLKVFTMISTFGTPQDITTDELRLEYFYPADEFSAEFFRQMEG